MANIELPKDAEGRDIPLDTKSLYLVRDGLKQNVERFTFELKDAEWSVETNIAIYDTEDFSLTQPDSWEKLDEDLSRIARSALERKAWPCAYFNRTPMKCYGCRADKCFGHCEGYVIDNIKSRILKLRGEDK